MRTWHPTDAELDLHCSRRPSAAAASTGLEMHLASCPDCMERSEEMTAYASSLRGALMRLHAGNRDEALRRLLIVDEDEGARQWVSTMLGSQGIEVACLAQVDEDGLNGLPGGVRAFDTALVDSRLGDSAENQTARLLHQENPKLRIAFWDSAAIWAA